MKASNLIWIIPITLILGLALGFIQGVEVVIPEEITIEVGEQYTEVMERLENVTEGQVYKKLSACQEKLLDQEVRKR